MYESEIDALRQLLLSQKDLQSKNIEVIEHSFMAVADLGKILSFGNPIKVSGFIFFVCLQGEMILDINLQEHHISANTLLITTPQQVLQVASKSDDFTGKALFIEQGMAQDIAGYQKDITSIFLYVKDHPCIQLSDAEKETFCEYHEFLMKSISWPSMVMKKQIASGILLSLFYSACEVFGKKILAESPSSERSRKQVLFEQFLGLVTKHYKSERSIQFYAGKMCITPKYLSAIIKQVSGRYAGEWIDQAVILEAKVMLRNTSLTVQQIAIDLHFANQSFFGKYFKQHTGVSPNAYRKS